MTGKGLRRRNKKKCGVLKEYMLEKNENSISFVSSADTNSLDPYIPSVLILITLIRSLKYFI